MAVSGPTSPTAPPTSRCGRRRPSRRSPSRWRSRSSPSSAPRGRPRSRPVRPPPRRHRPSARAPPARSDGDRSLSGPVSPAGDHAPAASPCAGAAGAWSFAHRSRRIGQMGHEVASFLAIGSSRGARDAPATDYDGTIPRQRRCQGVHMRFHLSRRAVMGGAAAATAAGLAGCLTNPADSSGDGDGGGSGGGAAGDGVVTILGNFGGVEADGFNAALESFQEDTGITVEYTSDQDFATTIRTRASAGDAPDIALFPQPGGLLDLAAEGHVAPISDYLDVDSLQSSLISGFLESATLEDQIYAAPMRMAVKSLVWYPTAAYEEGGWSTEPATLQELYGIAEEIKDSGIAPWADAWNADQSTGWVGTDWLEEFTLRIHGPEVYDQWTSHEIPFNDPRVVEALDHLGELLLTEGNVLGGSQTILNTEFSEASLPLFEDPPRAMLHRQGNFVTGFFPED